MESTALSQLLQLPAGDRAELAMALWESLSDAERQGELALTEEQGAEIDRRWASTWPTLTPQFPGLTCGECFWASGEPRSSFPASGGT